MGLFSWFQKDKDNYLSINYKAEIAKFKEHYRSAWIESQLEGRALENLIDMAEKRIVEGCRTLTTWDKDINFKLKTYDFIMDDLWDAIELGRYTYRGEPAFETKLYVKFYKQLVRDSYGFGWHSQEEANALIEELNEMVSHNG